MLKRINVLTVLSIIAFALMMLAVGFVEENPIASAVCNALMIPVTYLIYRESGQKRNNLTTPTKAPRLFPTANSILPFADILPDRR